MLFLLTELHWLTQTGANICYTYRLYNGLGYGNMGKLLGVDATAVAGWEKNEQLPCGERLNKLKTFIKDK